MNAKELEHFAAEHPLMVELVLESICFTANYAIKFIREMKLMKQIGFSVCSLSKRDRILKKFEGEWKSKVSTNGGVFYIELNRR